MASVTGVDFPESGGRRSTSDFGRQVVSAALAGVDPVGSASVARETNVSLPHAVSRLVEAGLPSTEAAPALPTMGCGRSTRAWSSVLVPAAVGPATR